VHFAAYRLKYSRWVHVVLVPNERVEALVRALLDSFLHAGAGVPLRAVFDNPKTVVVKHVEGRPVWNATLGAAAIDYGFTIELCTPRQPQQKGAVENLVGFVKRSFFRARLFQDLTTDLPRQLAEWLLEFALHSIQATPGDRVLDIGGGWGAFVEFAGKRGVRVTSLTISEPSRRFIQELIDREQLPCEVRLEHFFEHTPSEPYDAIVNLGVTEHLPDYPATVQRYHELLKPNGRVYLDASAARVRHDLSSFFERHIFRGNGTPLHLPGYVNAVTRSPLQLLTVIDDRDNYRLTTKAWAEGLDKNRDELERRWGRAQYRRFQIYLWGCVDGFRRDELQAYRLVLRRD
jgi:cyclopropane fatty-acyl-phospholipid synthase-like methyltransferase